MHLTLKASEGGVAQVHCEGDVTQARFPSNANNPLEDLLGAQCYEQKVLLDLEKSGYIDSSGIGWLMACHKRFLQAKGQLVIHSVPPLVEQVIHVLRLHSILTIKPDLASAQAFLREPKTHP